MASELTDGLGIYETLLDVAKGLKDIDSATARDAAIMELREHILTAQKKHFSLIQRVSDLEKEAVGFETWEAEKERYDVAKLPPGIVVYAVKESMRGTEPEHYICALCYQRGQKRYLQSGGPSDGIERLLCHECKNEVIVRA
jgi:hypothetical protein